ncbi:hypothetical protein [Corynebacterium uterequi]|uniref:Uncharacterized protein n=1 Tax=Corynebacterium uterequi TaxID=1072256 RepID=A0A0G3HEI1_9CORY|nr:hypothetical protein [Corynebacterium uterequi]AKK11694.1 hypothetical protein CUTER_08560 [Corynebacterium uterequi]
MHDRYKAMGLEMLPSKHYNVRRQDKAPGTAWVYHAPKGVTVVKFDGEKILTATSKRLEDVNDWHASGVVQKYIVDCAERDIPPQDAIELVRQRFGEPDLVVQCADVNDVSPEVREAIGADPEPAY